MRGPQDDAFELQSRSSALTTASSSDSDELARDASLGLRRLSTSAKHAMKLNQIHHVSICATYDDDSGATVYVLNVYLRYVQKGLPPPAPQRPESEKQRKQRLRLQWALERPVYQVEHRYSAFRELRRRVVRAVNAPGDHKHAMQCAYCSRVKFIDSAATFPPRVPNRGLVARVTGWQSICTLVRKRQLESFINQLLRAAKDLSYRTGSGQCERFLVVSQVLNSFLTEPSMRAAVW